MRADSVGTFPEKTHKRVKRPRLHYADSSCDDSRDSLSGRRAESLRAGLRTPRSGGDPWSSSDSAEDSDSAEGARARIALSDDEELALSNVELSPLELSKAAQLAVTAAADAPQSGAQRTSHFSDLTVAGTTDTATAGGVKAGTPRTLLHTPVSSLRELDSAPGRCGRATTYTTADADCLEAGSTYRCATPTHEATPRPPVQCDMVALHRSVHRARLHGYPRDNKQHGNADADADAVPVAEGVADDEGVVVTDEGVILPPSAAAMREGLLLALPSRSGDSWEPFEASAAFMPPLSDSGSPTTPHNHWADREAWRVRTEAQQEGSSLLS